MPEVIFNGPDGRLEGRYQHGRGATPPLAIVLHPSAEQGGTMNNRVAYTLYNVFAKRGFSVLRFNFRGVGRSQGEFDQGQGELRDAASALDWMQSHNPNSGTVWVAGFQFGAWIAMQLLMRRPEIEGFVCAALPANQYDFTFLAPCPSSGLIVQGERDAFIPVEPVTKLIHKLSHQRGITITHDIIPGADHFFSKHADAFARRVNAYLDVALAVERKPVAYREETAEDEPVAAAGDDDE